LVPIGNSIDEGKNEFSILGLAAPWMMLIVIGCGGANCPKTEFAQIIRRKHENRINATSFEIEDIEKINLFSAYKVYSCLMKVTEKL